jgi:hypothetical protein
VVKTPAVGCCDLEGGVREEFGMPARAIEEVVVADARQDGVATELRNGGD